MLFASNEYIVRGYCPLTDEEFVFFMDMQRRFGMKERWSKYNNPYLYLDDYKHSTMEHLCFYQTMCCGISVLGLFLGLDPLKSKIRLTCEN